MEVELLVGQIASGKSTYSRNAARNGALVVNDDAIVTAMHGGEYGLYSPDLKRVYKSVEHTIISMGLEAGRRVVIDRPNHTRVMRARYIAIAKSFDARVRVVRFPSESPEEHARRRWESDARGRTLVEWIEVARRHEREFEVPDVVEGFDELVERGDA